MLDLLIKKRTRAPWPIGIGWRRRRAAEHHDHQPNHPLGDSTKRRQQRHRRAGAPHTPESTVRIEQPRDLPATPARRARIGSDPDLAPATPAHPPTARRARSGSDPHSCSAHPPRTGRRNRRPETGRASPARRATPRPPGTARPACTNGVRPRSCTSDVSASSDGQACTIGVRPHSCSAHPSRDTAIARAAPPCRCTKRRQRPHMRAERRSIAHERTSDAIAHGRLQRHPAALAQRARTGSDPDLAPATRAHPRTGRPCTIGFRPH